MPGLAQLRPRDPVRRPVFWSGCTRVRLVSALGMSLAALAAASPAGAAPCSAPLTSAGTATVTCPVGTDDTWTAPCRRDPGNLRCAGGGRWASNQCYVRSRQRGPTTAPLTVNPGTTHHIAVGQGPQREQRWRRSWRLPSVAAGIYCGSARWPRTGLSEASYLGRHFGRVCVARGVESRRSAT